jgi:ectoine hydroxylase-related dioxygenase (phytanoyl-CoA dioxygenase family)
MAYVPTSHKLGSLRVVDITHKSEPYDILADPLVSGIQPESVEVKAGSIIWHDGFTIHQAHANQSSRTRKVFTVVYLASGYPRVKSWPVFPLDRAGVEVGEVMQGEGLPVVWPPPAQLPRPPEVKGQVLGPQHG